MYNSSIQVWIDGIGALTDDDATVEQRTIERVIEKALRAAGYEHVTAEATVTTSENADTAA
jgi:hypothetical protein